ECYELINYWCDTLRYDGSKREKDISIRNEFIAANKIISNPPSSQIHPDAIYTSRLLSRQLDLESLPEPKNSTDLTATPSSEFFISDEDSH
ncbi:3375_t:CDS:2, partial [Dentiscutata heterogama]